MILFGFVLPWSFRAVVWRLGWRRSLLWCAVLPPRTRSIISVVPAIAITAVTSASMSVLNRFCSAEEATPDYLACSSAVDCCFHHLQLPWPCCSRRLQDHSKLLLSPVAISAIQPRTWLFHAPPRWPLPLHRFSTPILAHDPPTVATFGRSWSDQRSLLRWRLSCSVGSPWRVVIGRTHSLRCMRRVCLGRWRARSTQSHQMTAVKSSRGTQALSFPSWTKPEQVSCRIDFLYRDRKAGVSSWAVCHQAFKSALKVWDDGRKRRYIPCTHRTRMPTPRISCFGLSMSRRLDQPNSSQHFSRLKRSHCASFLL